METIKKYNVDRMRSMASRHIHEMFRGAAIISVVYKDTFAEASCLWPDGVREFAALFYRDIERGRTQCNQYDRARRMVEETCKTMVV